MKKIFMKITLCFCLLVSVITLSVSSKVKNNIDCSQSAVKYNVNGVEQAKSFNYYNVTRSEDYVLVEAIEDVNSKQIENLNYNFDRDNYTIAYSLNYDLDADYISVIMTTTCEEEILNVEELCAYPIIYANGEIDAYVFMPDGTTVYMSELFNEDIKNCFALTLSFSIAALISAAITAAKVTLVVTAVIVVGGLTVEAIQMTKSKIEEKTRAAEAEKTKKNPSVYYPAVRKDGKLLITNAPQGLSLASENILTGQDYWSPFAYTAKDLATAASGGYLGPEIDSNKSGYYWHYHLAGKIGGHSFYGTPSGGAY